MGNKLPLAKINTKITCPSCKEFQSDLDTETAALKASEEARMELYKKNNKLADEVVEFRKREQFARTVAEERVGRPLKYKIDDLEGELSETKRVANLLAGAAVDLAESVERAHPDLRDSHETGVMEAWAKMVAAQRAAMELIGTPEALAEWDGGAIGEMFRMLELSNAARDEALADVDSLKKRIAELEGKGD
jgi:hypothetical protein